MEIPKDRYKRATNLGVINSFICGYMEYEKIRKSEEIFKLVITESQNSHRLTWQI